MNAARQSSVPLPLKEYLREPAIKAQLQTLRTLSVRRFLQAVAFDYAVIAAAVTTTVTLLDSGGSLWVAALTYPLAVLLIAARQHALLVLMHEGAHSTISRNRALNDWLSDLLCGAPLLVSTRAYRTNHLAHHQNLNSANDPDWCRKIDDAAERSRWQFPSTLALPKLLSQLYRHSVVYLLRSLADNQADDKSQQQNVAGTAGVNEPTQLLAQQQPSDQALRYAKYTLYLGILVVGCALFSPAAFVAGVLAFWLVPMLLVLPLIMRIRSIAEHFALRHDHPLTQTRSVRANAVERLLIAPHNIGLHIDHHLLASVPFFNLPRLHQLLLGSAYYRANAHINNAYFFGRPGSGRFADDLYDQVSVRLAPETSG